MNSTYFNFIIPVFYKSSNFFSLINSLLLQDYSDFQIICVDNSNDIEIKNRLENLEKVVYISSEEKISLGESLELGCKKAEKGFILPIGQEDFLFHQALKMLDNILKIQNIDLISSRKATFYPSDFREIEYQNLLAIPSESDQYYTVNAKEVLTVAENWMYFQAIPEFMNLSMPMPLHGGVFSVSLYQKVISQYQNCFINHFPDYYSSILLCSLSTDFLQIDTPFYIRNANDYYFPFQTESLNESLEFCNTFAFFASEAIISFHLKKELKSRFEYTKLLEKVYFDATFKSKESDYKEIVDSLRKIALKVKQEKFLEKLIIKNPFRGRVLKRPEIGLNKMAKLEFVDINSLDSIDSQFKEYLNSRNPSFLNNFAKVERNNRFLNFGKKILKKIGF